MHSFLHSLFYIRDIIILDPAPATATMKILLFFHLLTTTMYFSSYNISISSPSVIFLKGRRSMREQRILPLHRNVQDKNKAFDEETKQMTIQEHVRVRAHQHLSNNDLDLVYHIDYQGVTTHPIPTPKHPKP
ncbi:uncharacterized protein LOC110600174 isoform X2 [Manihot esculenta]|uniref:Uncharacterized protein n=2 Tax=Manihot esculenta TaxID=3983 RepID=A0ACB7GHR6_MANES|nr:uncharacterized protein LOC110600174 isoform X2 [Manihot esculenta]KAG8639872.1 hypothetical protein MANES_14G174300v8 [Manihot esculenta]